jgi:hypothetical protein
LLNPGSFLEYLKFYLKDIEGVIMEHLRRAFAEREYERYRVEFEQAMELIKEY